MEEKRSVNWHDTVNLGSIELKNRVCMAALTRQRCDPADGVPNQLLVDYYSQRTGAAIILSEAASWAQSGQCFPGAACLYTQSQAEGWKKVVHAIHARHSKIFIQIFHGGRACMTKTTKGIHPIGPSEIAIRDSHRRMNIPHQVPKALTLDDIEILKNQFRNSIKLAKECNFDGVQLHGAHGYLVDSFIRSESNKRTDKYGGSAENRCRLALELIDIILQYFKPEQVGIKISPVSRLNDMYDSDPVETYSYLCDKLSERSVGFLEIRESNEVNIQQTGIFEDITIANP